jgi:hypothetical protein
MKRDIFLNNLASIFTNSFDVCITTSGSDAAQLLVLAAKTLPKRSFTAAGGFKNSA